MNLFSHSFFHLSRQWLLACTELCTIYLTFCSDASQRKQMHNLSSRVFAIHRESTSPRCWKHFAGMLIQRHGALTFVPIARQAIGLALNGPFIKLFNYLRSRRRRKTTDSLWFTIETPTINVSIVDALFMGKANLSRRWLLWRSIIKSLFFTSTRRCSLSLI